MAKNFSWLSTPPVQQLIKHLTYNNHEFKFVGGCVRNSLLNLPVWDYDIASNNTPLENKEHLLQQSVKVKDLGIEHGSILAIVLNTPFEITSLRKDIQTDGRHAVVEFSKNFAEDALRRDFTINALYLCPNTLEINDDVGGLDDLQKGIVKFIGSPAARIQEDYLRILRFFRFSALYSKVPFDPDVLEIIKIYAKNLSGLSAARISTEFYKIMNHQNPSSTLKVLQQYDILKSLLELCPQSVDNFPNFVQLEHSFNLHSVLYRIAFILNDIMALNKIIIKKADLQHVQNIILLKTFIKKHNLIDWNEFAYLLANYSFFDVCGALLCAASDHTRQHIYTNILHKILAKDTETFPVNGHHLLSLGVQDKKNIKLVLRQLKIIFWQYPLKTTEEYLKIAQNLIKANNY